MTPLILIGAGIVILLVATVFAVCTVAGRSDRHQPGYDAYEVEEMQHDLA